VSRLLHLLALVALMLAPASMHGAAAAPAVPHHGGQAMAADHCAGSEQQPEQERDGRAADCALACSAMPGAGAELAAAPLPTPAYDAAPAAFHTGTAPGSDPPPPRTA
jgi:hypothetical protein